MSKNQKETPLEFIEKAIRTGKFQCDGAGGAKSKPEQKTLNKSLFEKSLREGKVYKPLEHQQQHGSSASFSSSSASSSSSSSNSKAKQQQQQNSKKKNEKHDQEEGEKAEEKEKQQEEKSINVNKIQFLSQDSLGAVIHLSHNSNNAINNPALLVFASDTNPGGSMSKKTHNLGTQEENICARSTLYPVQKTLNYPIPDLGIAYVPHVQILVSSSGNADSKQQDQSSSLPVFGAVCCCIRQAVANANSVSNKEREFLQDKVKTILLAGSQNGHRSIILGAISCGAFSDGSEEYIRVIASSFKSVLLPSSSWFSVFDQGIFFAIPNKDVRKIFEKELGSS